MSSRETMYSILQELSRAFRNTFDEFDAENGMNFGVSAAYQGTVLCFDHSNDASLLVDMNRGLLDPYLVPVLSDDSSGFMELHFPDAFLELRRTASWVGFTITPAEYEANRNMYLQFMRFALNVYLLENGRQIPFDATLNGGVA